MSAPLGPDGTENPVVDTGRDTWQDGTQALDTARALAPILAAPLTALVLFVCAWFAGPSLSHTSDGVAVHTVPSKDGAR
jgi:hypothetical protein